MELEKVKNWGLPVPSSRIAPAIFSKLPISNLPACRLVSKSWNRLILEYAATTNSSPKAIIYASNDHHPSNFDPCFLNPKIHCFDIDTLSFVASCTIIGPLTQFINIWSCCNGLLFLQNGGIDIGCDSEGIFNPMTHEFFPTPIDPDNYNGFFHAFGFSPTTNQYKLFLVRGPECSCDMKILRFGGRNRNQWISVSLPFCVSVGSHGTYMNGVVYWLGRDNKDEDVMTIYALDVETESFEVAAVLEVGARPDTAFLQAFNGTIYAQIYIYKSSQIQMWRMQVKDSWIKEFIVCGNFRNKSLELLKALDVGKIIVRINKDLFWLNKDNNISFKKEEEKENKIKTLNIPSDGREFFTLCTCLIETLHFGSLSSILAGDGADDEQLSNTLEETSTSNILAKD